MTDKSYPLHWPKHWPRTKAPGSSQFKTSLNGALQNVQDSLRKFAGDSEKKVENVIISSNVTLGQQKPADAGVAVYFTWDGLATCVCVDLYKKPEDNLQAIHHCIEAERTKLRHGGLNMVRASFTGYAALPPPSEFKRDFWEVLECQPGSGVAQIRHQYKLLAKKHHPDNGGGSHDKMAELNEAYQRALEAKGEI